MAGGALYNDAYNQEGYVLLLCLCNLCRSTNLFCVDRPGKDSKQHFKYFGGIKLIL